MTDGIPEPELASMLGVTLEVLRENRGQRGRDWVRVKHGVICWTLEASRSLAETLGVAFIEPPSPVVLHVAQVLPGCLLCAKRPEDLTRRDHWVMVRIPNNLSALFCNRMKISAMPGACLSWRYLGPENHPRYEPVVYPRRRGIWPSNTQSS